MSRLSMVEVAVRLPQPDKSLTKSQQIFVLSALVVSGPWISMFAVTVRLYLSLVKTNCSGSWARAV